MHLSEIQLNYDKLDIFYDYQEQNWLMKHMLTVY